jgi:hypothetical protein
LFPLQQQASSSVFNGLFHQPSFRTTLFLDFYSRYIELGYFMSTVDDIFEPVTWHHQRRPLFYVLACKTRKTRRGLAGETSSDDQVSPVFM